MRKEVLLTNKFHRQLPHLQAPSSRVPISIQLTPGSYTVIFTDALVFAKARERRKKKKGNGSLQEATTAAGG